MNVHDTACRGCGTCCRNGGPALHDEDMLILAHGVLLRRHLVTLRTGELAFNQVENKVLPLSQELVKVADASGGAGKCQFLQEPQGRCSFYEHRPVECRALLCRDTQAITALYDVNRLTRRDILQASNAPAGWDALMEAYDESCPAEQWDYLLRTVRDLRVEEKETASTSPQLRDAQNALNEAVRLDGAFRQLAHERALVPLDELSFLCGRSLPQVARAYSLRL